MHVLELLALVGAGLVAGTVNTMAGGGSLLTLPALVFIGLSAPIANGSNRVGVLLQSLVGARAMYARAPFPLRATLLASLPTLAGALAGAWLATQVDAKRLEVVIGCVLLGGAVLLVLRPGRSLLRPSPKAAERSAADGDGAMEAPRLTWRVVSGLLVVGFYGGFLQAGVGALFLVTLAALGGWDLLQATGAKNLLIAIYTAPALALFALHGQVAWVPGLVLAVGSMAGAELGARLAMRGGKRLVLWLVVAVVLISGAKMLGLLRLL